MAIVVDPSLILLTPDQWREEAERLRWGEPPVPEPDSELRDMLLARLKPGTAARAKLLRLQPRAGATEHHLHTPGTLTEAEWLKAASGHRRYLDWLRRRFRSG